MEYQTFVGQTKRLYFDWQRGVVHRSPAEVGRPLRLDRESLRWFLLLGYVPGNKTLFEGVERIPSGRRIRVEDGKYKIVSRRSWSDFCRPEKFRGASADDLAELGGRILAEAVARRLEGGKTICVPLSAGLDSRGILGALLEASEPANILSFTRGVPGTMDYEIGPRIARAVGIRHERINLLDLPFDLDALVATARETEGNVFLFDAFFHHVCAQRVSADEYWSGCMGDAIEGVHMPSRPWESPLDAVRDLLRRGGYNPSRHLVTVDLEEAAEFLFRDVPLERLGDLPELLDLTHLQDCMISHHVISPHAPFKTPYLDEAWLGFMLSVPRELRLGRSLFVKILMKRYPRLARFPSTYRRAPLTMSKAGLLLRRGLRRLRRTLGRPVRLRVMNYIDFDQAVRSRKDLHDLTRQGIADLEKRHVVPQGAPTRLWEAHQGGAVEEGRFLLLLLSLETILKAFNVRT